jgi:CRP-like cAMP-binding protein
MMGEKMNIGNFKPNQRKGDIMAEIKQIDGIWNTVFDKENKAKVEQNIVEVLKKVPIFEELSNREIQNIARIAYQRRYSENEVVIYEAQAAAGMYIIMEGEVKVTKESEDGTIIHLATFGDGAFFGDVGLLDNSPRAATVMATQESKIIGFFRPELLQLMDSNPKLASKVIFKLAQVLAARLRFTNNELEKAQKEIDHLKTALKDISEATHKKEANGQMSKSANEQGSK